MVCHKIVLLKHSDLDVYAKQFIDDISKHGLMDISRNRRVEALEFFGRRMKKYLRNNLDETPEAFLNRLCFGCFAKYDVLDYYYLYETIRYARRIGLADEDICRALNKAIPEIDESVLVSD